MRMSSGGPRSGGMPALAQAGILAVALVLTGACDLIDPSGPGDDLRFDARADLLTLADGQAVEAVLVVTNGRQETAHFRWGGCKGGVLLALYADAGRSGPPVWDSAAPVGAVCTLDLATRSVAPGETAEFSLRVPVSRLLDEGVDPGRYHLAVAPDFSAPLLDGPELPAGDFPIEH